MRAFSSRGGTGRGTARLDAVGLGWASQGMAGYGSPCFSGPDLAGLGLVRLGAAPAPLPWAWQGFPAALTWRDRAWPGSAGSGAVRQVSARQGFPWLVRARFGELRLQRACPVWARQVRAPRGKSRPGAARCGATWWGSPSLGLARLPLARHGRVGQVSARRGLAWSGEPRLVKA